MNADFEIKDAVLTKYTGKGGDVVIPDGVVEIGTDAFRWNKTIRTVTLPDSITGIGSGAFCDCSALSSVTIPGSVKRIGFGAFRRCEALTSVVLTEGTEELCGDCFSNCHSLKSVVIPQSVRKIMDGPLGDFNGCDSVTIICVEDSYAHSYCRKNKLHFIFDYQYSSFGGLAPEPVETISSPFPADEEKPFIFISYSHKDSERIFDIIKNLYEEGWRMWYDEGLTIGDSYDKEIEKHVAECAVFLLFVTNNSQNSKYIERNEVPWGDTYQKPFIKCILDEGADITIPGKNPVTTVTLDGVGDALKATKGLTKGAKRVAKGITVTFLPKNRMVSSLLENTLSAEEKKSAYCLYSAKGANRAKSILYDVRNSGCRIYDAVSQGENLTLLRTSPCLIVFLDNEFLSDFYLLNILVTAFEEKRDLAICRIESVDLPDDLKFLKKIHWLNYSHGDDAVMNAHLGDYLGERGCRDSDVLPGFSYDMTPKGIIITDYSGSGTEPVIEEDYSGTPVIAIDDDAFKDCKNLKRLVIPDKVKRIGERTFENCTGLKEVIIGKRVEVIGSNAFYGCGALSSLKLPKNLRTIEDSAFEDCISLTELEIPPKTREIGWNAFFGCSGLTSVTIPDSVKKIDDFAFHDCKGLQVLDLGNGVKEIGWECFSGCSQLRSLTIPGSIASIIGFSHCESLARVEISYGVKTIGSLAFCGCENLHEITLSNSVTEIGDGAFKRCANLNRITIPDSVTSISDSAFEECFNLTVVCTENSYAYRYCEEKGIRVDAVASTAVSGEKERKKGFFSRVFGKKKKEEKKPLAPPIQEPSSEPAVEELEPEREKELFDEMTRELFEEGIFYRVLELDKNLGCVVNAANVIYLLFLYKYIEDNDIDQLIGIPIPKLRITKAADDMKYFYRYILEALDGGQCILMKEKVIQLFREKKKYTDQFGPDLENIDPDAEKKLIEKTCQNSE